MIIITACNSFPPIVAEEARVLILGSMPSEISLQQHQYYANPNNKFWAIIYAVLGLPLPTSYEQRSEGLKKVGIALWDMLAFCERQGSLDAGIKNEFANNIIDFLKRYPNIKMVVFNGTKAREMWKKHLGPNCDQKIEFHTLPSPSPAMTKLTLPRFDRHREYPYNKKREVFKWDRQGMIGNLKNLWFEEF